MASSIRSSPEQNYAAESHLFPMGENPRLLQQAVLQAVAYSDIFDYPLTATEIHRYLMNLPVSRNEIDDILHGGGLLPGYLSSCGDYFTLVGRETIVDTRRQREAEAHRRWPRALHYGQIIASLPFVRMVAVTGELAMDNMSPKSDIDYFIITEPGRLWLTRLLVIAVVRYAAPRGDVICPNFLLSEHALTLDDRNLYTAHEVAQMVPIAGREVYQRLRASNCWVDEFLPNASQSPRSVFVAQRAGLLRRLIESTLRTQAGARLERWEMERKIRKLTRGGLSHPEASFCPDWCKGHVDGHGERILTRFRERWDAVEGRNQ
ncbi:MAG: hypothetical protein H0V47_00305 [Chloroflexia bacterium]|nr:hypothetical protein [Chloroflexia bacterium]